MGLSLLIQQKIILTSIGSLGDLHPFIAIGIELQRRGYTPILAVPADHVEKASAAGLQAVAVLPSFETIQQRMGLTAAEAVTRIMADQNFLLDEVLIPWVATGARALDDIAYDVVAIVGSLFMFAAPIIAAKRRIPLISVVLQPMTMFSAYRPPRTPDFRLLRGTPANRIERAWNRLIYAGMRRVLRARYAATIDAVRAEHGLGSSGDAILFDPGGVPVLTLGCYSPAFGPLMPDAPPSARIVGFPIYDAESGVVGVSDPRLDAFLAAGPPPVVFTLGSLAVAAAGRFYENAALAVRQLGLRAVLLVGDQESLQSSPDVHVAAYAPHSTLFPRCSAIVHHGGVGTTGQALRAGKPQLVVPHMGDQNDNARRIDDMGVGRTLKLKDFDPARAATAIAHLLADSKTRQTAMRSGEIERSMDGARNAASEIDRALHEL